MVLPYFNLEKDLAGKSFARYSEPTVIRSIFCLEAAAETFICGPVRMQKGLRSEIDHEKVLCKHFLEALTPKD